MGVDRSPDKCEIGIRVDDAMVSVFPHLDFLSLLRCGLVCKSWKNIIDSRSDEDVWCAAAESSLRDVIASAGSLVATCSCARNRAPLSTERNQFEFLQIAADNIHEYATVQSKAGHWMTFPDRKFASRIFAVVAREVDAAFEAMRAITETGVMFAPPTFGIYAFALERYEDELRTMLPLRPATEAEKTSVDARLSARGTICDDRILGAWSVIVLGKRCKLCCGFDEFYEAAVARGVVIPTRAGKPYFLRESEEAKFRAHLHHFFDFPRDGMVTAHRFGTFVRLFGPAPTETFLNFTALVVGRGFVGMMDAIHAEQLMRELKPTCDTVFVRYSRNHPGRVSFTSFDARSRKMTHRRNEDDATKKVVSIWECLQKFYSGCAIADVGIPDCVAEKMTTTTEYAADKTMNYHVRVGRFS